MMTTFFKDKTVRDGKYLKFVKSLPCLICGTTYEVQPHHTASGGTALVGSDLSAVPLCFPHHREIHQKSSKRGPWSEEQLIEITTRLRAVYDSTQNSNNL